MIQLIDKGLGGSGVPKLTQFMTDDEIHIVRERSAIKITVHRKGTIIFLGKDCDISLHCYCMPRMTVEHVWLTTNLFLQANWILAEVTKDTAEKICATIRRIATCREEMDPRLPCCDAGGDGYGRE